jgi:hypothetical protein
MNIINIENVRKINGFVNRLEIETRNPFSDSVKTITMVILSEDDILNDNSLLKLKGYSISILLLPKKYKYTFNDLPVGKLIVPNLEKNTVISYY